MKYGVFSVSMPEYDIAETVALLKEVGYDGVEWRVNQIPKEVPSVRWRVGSAVRKFSYQFGT